MRKLRLLVHETFPQAAYHVISRVSHQRLLLGDEEKEHLIRLLRRYARFCGMRVLTFCIMSNHFHWLIEVEQKPAGADHMPDEELVARVRRCQGKQAAQALQQELQYARRMGQEATVERLRGKYLKRMWNLSAFVQSVKQRFSRWFNKRHGFKGTLWEDRFKSTVALGPEAVASMAAYIDLNPIRAKLVEDPGDYAWSGYGEAVKGGWKSKQARDGLERALCGREGSLLSAAEQKDYLSWYRRWIYGRGLATGVREDGELVKPGFRREEVARVQTQPETDAPCSKAELEKRVRYFSNGLVVGTKELLEQAFESARGYFGPKRKSGARKMRWGEWGALRSMRDLQKG